MSRFFRPSCFFQFFTISNKSLKQEKIHFLRHILRPPSPGEASPMGIGPCFPALTPDKE
jgi:hypothetical protein